MTHKATARLRRASNLEEEEEEEDAMGILLILICGMGWQRESERLEEFVVV